MEVFNTNIRARFIDLLDTIDDNIEEMEDLALSVGGSSGLIDIKKDIGEIIISLADIRSKVERF